jgi:hypothetical protein
LVGNCLGSFVKTENGKEVLMAVAVEMNFRGATLDQYDQVIEKMGLTPGGSGPPGAISHWVAKTDDGIRVVDVWETREVFDRFAEEQIGPLHPRGRLQRRAGDALLRRPQSPHGGLDA